MTIKWQDPPTNHGNQRTDWATIATALRERPGTWAVVAEDKKSASHAMAIKRGIIAAFAPAGTFQARAITVDGKFTIYARFGDGE